MGMMIAKNNEREMFPAAASMADLMNSMFSGFPEFPARWNSMFPASKLSVKVNDKDVSVRMPFAGCKASDFEIETSNDFLSVKVAKRSEPETNGKKHYTRRERSYEEYQESVRLPVEVKSGEAKAKYTDGVLEISIPRAESKKTVSRVITVQ